MIADQLIAAVIAALVPVIAKLIVDWNRVALTRAGHADIADGEISGSATATPPPAPEAQSPSTQQTPTTPPTERPPSP